MTVVLLVVLVLMFVRLKQFTRQNNNNTQKMRKPGFIIETGLSHFYILLFISVQPMLP